MKGASARFVVVGLGGIGEKLLRMLVAFLRSEGRPATILAIDGDRFESRNRARMAFRRVGPKAEVLVEELAECCGDALALIPVPQYLTPRNVARWIEEGDVVFLAPDNHATRRLVERRCARLRNVTLFCGGNDGVENGQSGTCGTVFVYRRRRGRDLTNPPSRFHPEIRRPADALPGAAGCAAQLESAPQLLFTNLAVAAAMLGGFHAWRAGELEWEEMSLDIHAGRAASVRRVRSVRKRQAPR